MTPDPEVALLFREEFSDRVLQAMRLYWHNIVFMHNPIKDSWLRPSLFRLYYGELDKCVGDSDFNWGKWQCKASFVFVVPEKKSFFKRFLEGLKNKTKI